MPGRFARRSIRIIDRYQRTGAAHVYDGSCRFNPSCCTFMREAFETRPLPVAFLLSAWRLIRCNPLLHRETHDPVLRSTKRPRANGLRTAFAIVALTGLTVALVATAAQAQSLGGGCTGTINGRGPSTMTQSDPVVVKKGESVLVTGTVPPSLIGGDPSKVTSYTTFDVDVWDTLQFSSSGGHRAQGLTWGDTVNPDSYLTKGSGLYLFSVRSAIYSDRGNVVCTATGFIKFDGGKLVAAVAGGVGVVAGVGGALATGGKPSDVSADQFGKGLYNDFIVSDSPGTGGPSSDPNGPGVDVGGGGPATTTTIEKDRGYNGWCCMLAMLAVPLVAVGVAGGGGEMGGAGSSTSGSLASGTVVAVKRVYKRGHPIFGFLCGLIFWACFTIVLQQFSVWPITKWNGYVLPGVGALLTAIRAYIGRPYKFVKRVA